jgi:hypothetical protein
LFPARDQRHRRSSGVGMDTARQLVGEIPSHFERAARFSTFSRSGAAADLFGGGSRKNRVDQLKKVLVIAAVLVGVTSVAHARGLGGSFGASASGGSPGQQFGISGPLITGRTAGGTRCIWLCSRPADAVLRTGDGLSWRVWIRSRSHKTLNLVGRGRSLWRPLCIWTSLLSLLQNRRTVSMQTHRLTSKRGQNVID